MPAALWLLMRLRLKGWSRRLTRNLKTVKGIIFTAIFGLMAFFCVTVQIVNAIMLPRSSGTAPADQVERFGTVGLLIYCLGMILFSGTQSPIAFSPAEVQFLFSGPFSRRQLLAYRILTQFLLTLPVCIFLSMAMRATAGTYVGGLIAMVLIFLFLQLFGVAVNLIGSTLGEMMYSRQENHHGFDFARLGGSCCGWLARERRIR